MNPQSRPRPPGPMRWLALLICAMPHLHITSANAAVVLAPTTYSMAIQLGEGTNQQTADNVSLSDPSTQGQFNMPQPVQEGDYGISAYQFGSNYLEGSQSWFTPNVPNGGFDGITAAIASIGFAGDGIKVTATGTGNVGGSVIAEASESYQFEVNGPSGLVKVVFGSASGGVNTNFTAPDAYFIILGIAIPNTQSIVDEFLTPSLNDQTSFNASGSYYLPANTVVEVDMQASVIISGDYSATAYIDPTFAVDPSTPNASAYSISYSDGLIAPTDIPEPSSIILMIAGIAGLGYLATARRVPKPSDPGDRCPSGTSIRNS